MSNILRQVSLTVLGLAFLGAPAMAEEEQSPIKITPSVTEHAPGANRIDYFYSLFETLTLDNTYDPASAVPKEFGTLRATPASGSSYVIADGIRYNLLQFHFHTPAEHRINQKQEPMEVHFVHFRHDVPLVTGGACSVPRPVLVIGALISRGGGTSELQKIFEPELPTQTGSTVQVNGVNLSKLLPGGGGGPSWQYDGGLTAPSTICSAESVAHQIAADEFPEIVNWHVLDREAHLPKEAIEKFRELFEEGNTRPVEPVGDRRVYRDPKRK